MLGHRDRRQDLLQLVGPASLYILPQGKDLRSCEVRERFGVPPESVVEIMGLMGRRCGQYPGVPGIGEKTAQSLIKDTGPSRTFSRTLTRSPNPKLKQSLLENGTSRGSAASWRSCITTCRSISISGSLPSGADIPRVCHPAGAGADLAPEVCHYRTGKGSSTGPSFPRMNSRRCSEHFPGPRNSPWTRKPPLLIPCSRMVACVCR